MIEVEYRAISKTYDPGLFKKKVLAVDSLNLQVRCGEVFGLIGPNGAGKSTTIRMLLGLIRPSRGEILFRGAPLTGACLQREVGYLPENPYLYDHLTLDELLVFCGTTSGMATATVRGRINELLARLDLEAARNRPLRTFSKGMLQRAGICFALLHDPAMVILDEPMSGLDPIGRRMVFDLISELKSRGKTVFFCSHILSDVERLCDRIGIMAAGRLVEEIDAESFALKAHGTATLILAGCPAGLPPVLSPMVKGVEAGGERQVLKCPVDDLARVMRLVDESGAAVLSCHTEQHSLEDLFLRAVSGGR